MAAARQLALEGGRRHPLAETGRRPGGKAELRRSLVMSGSSEDDPEGGQGPAGVAGVVSEGGGEVDRPARHRTPMASDRDDALDQPGGAAQIGAMRELRASRREGGIAMRSPRWPAMPLCRVAVPLLLLALVAALAAPAAAVVTTSASS